MSGPFTRAPWPPDHVPVAPAPPARRGWRFWLAMIGACAVPVAYAAFLFFTR